MNYTSHTYHPIGQHIVNHHAMLIPEAIFLGRDTGGLRPPTFQSGGPSPPSLQ